MCESVRFANLSKYKEMVTMQVQVKLYQFNKFGKTMPKKFLTKIVGMHFYDFNVKNLSIGEQVFLKESTEFAQGLEVYTSDNKRIGSIFERIDKNNFIEDKYFNNHRMFLFYKGYNFYVKEIHRNVIILDAIVK